MPGPQHAWAPLPSHHCAPHPAPPHPNPNPTPTPPQPHAQRSEAASILERSIAAIEAMITSRRIIAAAPAAEEPKSAADKLKEQLLQAQAPTQQQQQVRGWLGRPGGGGWLQVPSAQEWSCCTGQPAPRLVGRAHPLSRRRAAAPPPGRHRPGRGQRLRDPAAGLQLGEPQAPVSGRACAGGVREGARARGPSRRGWSRPAGGGGLGSRLCSRRHSLKPGLPRSHPLLIIDLPPFLPRPPPKVLQGRRRARRGVGQAGLHVGVDAAAQRQRVAAGLPAAVRRRARASGGLSARPRPYPAARGWLLLQQPRVRTRLPPHPLACTPFAPPPPPAATSTAWTASTAPRPSCGRRSRHCTSTGSRRWQTSWSTTGEGGGAV
jgi:hypothetical protein